MKKLFIFGLTLSLATMQSALAVNLGALTQDHQPKNLKPSQELLKLKDTNSPAGKPHKRIFEMEAIDQPRETVNAVCYAADFTGNWYSFTAPLMDAEAAQEAANMECVASGWGCYSNLGCDVVS